MKFTRREWIRLASTFGATQLLGGRGACGQPQPLFVEVPPTASGIGWVHENAMSPSRYLPEALGPGCAFLDFDNDGWMDIFLVNSGPSDFWKPAKPVRNALYKNNRDGTFRCSHAGVDDQLRVVRLRQRRQDRLIRLQLRRLFRRTQTGVWQQQDW